jgi:hypothetical protein
VNPDSNQKRVKIFHHFFLKKNRTGKKASAFELAPKLKLWIPKFFGGTPKIFLRKFLKCLPLLSTIVVIVVQRG